MLCTIQANVNYYCPNGATILECLRIFVHLANCTEGYELQGSNNGTCLANGSWSQGNPLCVLICPSPPYGEIYCSTGNNCNFSCDPGYMLQGSVTSGICENSGNWSEGLPSCEPLTCRNRKGRVLDSGHTVSSCPLEYQSNCTAFCDEGFTGDNITRMCDIRNNNPTRVFWRVIDGEGTMCVKGM